MPKRFITSDEVVRGKPDPEPYLLAASALGFPIVECVVIEDVPAGIRAGKAAGARVIALETTSQRSELLAAGADWVVRDCRAITVSVDGNALRVLLRD
jgi:sugar-phosphatase